MTTQRRREGQTRRRAATAVMVVVTLPVLLGMAALTVDVAVMYNTRTDLQRSADAAALAAASSLLTDSMMAIRLGSDDASHPWAVEATANARAVAVAALNPSLGQETTYVEASDIRLGYLDLSSATSPLVANPVPPQHLNAVRVTVRRSAESANGSVGLFFAPIFGKMSTDVTATATAAFDTRVLGLTPSGEWLVPFTIDEDYYEDQVDTGNDNYSYDDDSVAASSDDIREVRLYPHYDERGREDTTSGNFGLVNIPSSSSMSVPDLRDQIENGIEPDDLVEDIGDTELVFEDEFGHPFTYLLNGNPGFKSTLERDVEARIGDIISFFLHDDVSGCPGAKEGGCGTNTYYRIVGVRFGRVMAVDLSGGGPHGCEGVVVQPVTFSGPGIRLGNTGTTSLEDTAGLIVLAR